MRKKELQARDEALRGELAEANQLAASQVKRLNELRMEIAFLERAPDMAAPYTGRNDARPHEPASTPRAAEPDLKACPDCAERVRSAARKCRYCAYRFDGTELGWSDHGPKDGASKGATAVARLGTASGT